MAGRLDDTDTRRMDRTGVLGFSTAEGLALLDAALGIDEPLSVPVRLARTVAAGTTPPPLLRGLVRGATRPAGAAGPADAATALRRRLAAAPAEVERILAGDRRGGRRGGPRARPVRRSSPVVPSRSSGSTR